MIRLAFRFDDPSETSDQEIEAGVIEALRQHEVCATFAVIPFRMINGEKVPLSASRARPLVKAMQDGIIEIAQHGYLHLRRDPEPAPPTEFAGRTRGEQLAMIQSGREHLESIFGQCIDGFCPPWNSYDLETLTALDTLGFKYLTAGPRHTLHSFPLKTIPLTTHLKNFPDPLIEAESFRLANPVIIVVMHHYDFAESGSPNPVTDIRGFGHILSMIRRHQGIQVCMLGQVAKAMCTDLAQLKRQQHMARYRFLHKLIPRHAFLNASIWRSALSRLVYG